MSECDGTYSKIIAEYQASLDKIRERIRVLRKKPDLTDAERRQYATYCQMRHEHLQAIKAMKRHI